MATTRLMPLHTGKGRTMGQAIRGISDCTGNPQKTDGGSLNEINARKKHVIKEETIYFLFCLAL